MTVLHVSPHPDDEIIGAGATLLSLRKEGHRVFNLACGLGSEADQERRKGELEDALDRAGFDGTIHDPPLDISHDHSADAAQETLERTLTELIPKLEVSVVVSPSPHDGHPAHEVVGRATRDALRALGKDGTRWWMWGIWGDLPLPTLMFEFDAELLKQVLHVLSAHAEELARNDYRVLVEARARMNSVLGPERVFDYGDDGADADYVELLTEAFLVEGSWHLGSPRRLDPSDPFPTPQPEQKIDWWLDAPSVSERASRARGSR